MGKIVGIILVAGLLIFGGYKIIASSVDRGNPQEVGTEFLKQLKREEVSKAAKYYLPAEAEAWEKKTKEVLYGLKSNGMAMFKQAIPDEPTFVDVPSPKGSTDKTMKAGETILSLRQVDGDWYVSKSSQP